MAKNTSQIDIIKMNTQIQVSIIIPACNEAEHIGLCLRNLKKSETEGVAYEVIVVDNGSTDETNVISQQYSDKTIKLATGHVGAVRNYGVKHSKGEILVFLDADCLVSKKWLKNGIRYLRSAPRLVVGGGLKLKSQPSWIERCWLLNYNHYLPNDLLGCTIFIRRKDFDIVGGFNEDVTSGEDTELSIRLKKSGYDVVIAETASVIHLGTPATISKFMKRQVWHSENYFISLKTSFLDPMFWSIILFLSLTTFSIISLLLTGHGLIPFFTALLIPLLLSIRRLKCANFNLRNYKDLPLIFFLDILYVLSRSAGLLKGLILWPASSRS